MKYKFDLPPAIKALAEWQLENYRKDKKLLQEIEADMIYIPIASNNIYGGGRATTVDSRPTEKNAINLVSAPYIQRMEMGVNAVERALRGADPNDLKLISLVYWTKTNSVEGASVKCNMSKSCAYKRLNEILACIAYGMGYIRLS